MEYNHIQNENEKENENEENSSSTYNSNNNNINNNNNRQNNINNNHINLQRINLDINPRSTELKIISNISNVFSDICENNMKEYITGKNQRLIKPFITLNPPIKIKDYLEHLYKYGRMNSSTIILMLIYIDRFCNINKIKLTYSIIHKLVLASMIVAVKYNEDEIYSTKCYAQFGGVSKNELLELEYKFIININFNLYVNEELFNKYYDYFFYFADEDSDEDDEDE